MARKSRSEERPRRKRERLSLGAELLSFGHSNRADWAADYARRGRKHATLSDQQLAEEWEAAFRAMAEHPLSDELRASEQDLRAEFDLRGKMPPFDEVRDAIETLGRSVREQWERGKADPDAWEASGEAFKRDFEAYRARRDRSKN